ncbi:MAG: hypothetical protein LBL86_11500, partial [Coriobacteriales bacterium]|nr:hypothetical protein [Coriobacteriales bacterium]
CAGSEGVESATGLEVDGEVGEAAKTLWGDRLDVIVGDFAQAPPVGPAANLLISNPPYVRHHYIGSESIDVLDLSFHVFNKDTWDTVFDSDMISIGFN